MLSPLDDNSVAFTVPGQYRYICPAHNKSTNLFQVVTAQHKITVCGSANCSKKLTIKAGDVVYWSIVDIDNCSSLRLVNTNCIGSCIIHNYTKLIGKV